MEFTTYKSFFVIALFLFCSANLSAQQESLVSGQANGYQANTYIDIFDLRDTSLKGTVYLDEKWDQATVHFNTGEVHEFPAMYDVKRQVLEIKVDKDVRIVPHTAVEFFKLPSEQAFYDLNTYYVNREKTLKDYQHGFYELIEAGEVTLWKKYDVKVMPSNYNAALDSGTKNDRLFKTEHYYICDGRNVVQLSPQKKKSLIALATMSPDIEKIASKERTKFSNEDSLKELIRVINDKN